MKDKVIPFPNLGSNIILEAPTLGANNLFHYLTRKTALLVNVIFVNFYYWVLVVNRKQRSKWKWKENKQQKTNNLSVVNILHLYYPIEW